MFASSSTTLFDLDDFVARAVAEYSAAEAAPSGHASVTVSADGERAAVVDAVVEPPPVLPTLTLAEGQSLFSKLFGAVPKNIKDFAVSPMTDVHPSMVAHIPAADPYYVVQVEEAARLVAAIEDGDKTLITGPTGSGKSSLVKYVCAKIGAPFIRINMSADVESSTLFGQLVVREGATVWEDGPITEAVRYGGVVLVDEWELMPPEISMGMQNLLEDDGYLYVKEMPGTSDQKKIIPAKNFRIIMAGNTVGQGDDSGGFAGTMVQNTATIDRFTATICLDYLSREHESAFIVAKGGVSEVVADNMIKLATLIRNGHSQHELNLTMSPRTLINWAKKFVRYGDMRYAFGVAYYDKLRESDKKGVMSLYSKVFGS